MTSDMLWNAIIRVSMALIMISLSISYVFHFEKGKLKFNSSRTKLILGIILTVISVGYLIYAF